MVLHPEHRARGRSPRLQTPGACLHARLQPAQPTVSCPVGSVELKSINQSIKPTFGGEAGEDSDVDGGLRQGQRLAWVRSAQPRRGLGGGIWPGVAQPYCVTGPVPRTATDAWCPPPSVWCTPLAAGLAIANHSTLPSLLSLAHLPT